MTFELSGVAQGAYDHDGRIMVLGGPGSGKTTLSLLKAQRLIPGLEQGQNVLFLSFSRAAVRQVINRTKDVLSKDEGSRITVKTYHSFCMDILRAHGRLISGRPARILFPDREKIRKASYQGEWQIERERLTIEEGLYAFDNFASGATSLITKVIKVAELIADRFPVIILDEFQDTSDSQWELVQALAERSELIVLADPDQRIFEYDDRVDPERLNQVRKLLAPTEFDLGGDNHRSPDAGILSFANAVLQNRELPKTDDVAILDAWPSSYPATTHAASLWLYAKLRKEGISKPSIAVLARTNGLVSEISNWYSQSHRFQGREYGPISHDVLWDAETSAAAAQVVATILEWSGVDASSDAASTLDAVAAYFDVKNATATSGPLSSAVTLRERYKINAQALRDGKGVRPIGAKWILAKAVEGVSFVGNPKVDWMSARTILESAGGLEEVAQAVRFVRLFGATNEIGGLLSEQWDKAGNYSHATGIVRRALDKGRLISEQREPQGFVLMNMHKSKGKEFDGVIVVEGPLHRGVFFSEREEPPHLATRRLLRVAITRARQKVVIIRPKGAIALIQ